MTYPEEFDELALRILSELKETTEKAAKSSEIAKKLEETESNISALSRVCQRKAIEIFNSKRKNNELCGKLEERGKELVSLVNIEQENSRVGCEDIGVQVDSQEEKHGQSAESTLQCEKYRDILVELLEENHILKTKVRRRNSLQTSYIPSVKRKAKNSIY